MVDIQQHVSHCGFGSVRQAVDRQRVPTTHLNDACEQESETHRENSLTLFDLICTNFRYINPFPLLD